MPEEDFLLFRWDLNLFFDREGRPIHILQHAQLIQDDNYRVLKQEEVGSYWVSTVWTGIDANLFVPKPQIFETMAFSDSGPEVRFRWITDQEAQEGHERIVQSLRRGETPENLIEWVDES